MDEEVEEHLGVGFGRIAVDEKVEEHLGVGAKES